MAVALDPAADERRADRPAADLRREAPDRDPGHRRGALGGDRATVEDRHGQAGGGVVEHHHGVDRRQAQRVVRREPGDPLHPDEVVAAVGGRAPQVGRHRVHERPVGSRVHRDLGRQLRIGDERGQRALGQLEPFGERRHRGRDVGRGEVADRAPGHPGECTRHLG